jgi:hypothetical protein
MLRFKTKDKIKIAIEYCLPLLATIVIFLVCNFFKIFDTTNNLEPFSLTSSMSFIFSTAVITILITHKTIILSIDKDKNDGFKALLNREKMYNRFLSFLNRPLYASIGVAGYNIFCDVIKSVYDSRISFFLNVLLLFQLIRFLYIFNKVFEKNIKSK